MTMLVNVDVGASTGISAKGGYYASEVSHNSPTNDLRKFIGDILSASRDWYNMGLTTAFVVNTAGATVGTVSFGSRGTYWVAGSFTAPSTSTVATIHVMGAYYSLSVSVGAGETLTITNVYASTYFTGNYNFTITAGWVYSLTVSLSGSASASGLTLSPVGNANLVSTPLVGYIMSLLALPSEQYLGNYVFSQARWITNAGGTLINTGVGLSRLSDSVLVVSHNDVAFSGSGTIATVVLRASVGDYFTISLPATTVGTSDRGRLTITVSIQ